MAQLFLLKKVSFGVVSNLCLTGIDLLGSIAQTFSLPIWTIKEVEDFGEYKKGFPIVFDWMDS